MKKSGDNRDKERFKQIRGEIQKGLRRAYWKYIEGVVTPKE